MTWLGESLLLLTSQNWEFTPSSADQLLWNPGGSTSVVQGPLWTPDETAKPALSGDLADAKPLPGLPTPSASCYLQWNPSTPVAGWSSLFPLCSTLVSVFRSSLYPIMSPLCHVGRRCYYPHCTVNETEAQRVNWLTQVTYAGDGPLPGILFLGG